MSKYIIDTGDYLFTTDGVLVVGFDCDNKPATFYNSLDNLEELNSDYINEHFSDLQDEAYQRGLEDGRRKARVGCRGCKYERQTGEHLPCEYCMNNFTNQWTAKPSDSIEVGDEVVWKDGTTLTVTRVHKLDDDEWCDGMDEDGRMYGVLKNDVRKTGKHYDIQSILEAMRK